MATLPIQVGQIFWFNPSSYGITQTIHLEDDITFNTKLMMKQRPYLVVGVEKDSGLATICPMTTREARGIPILTKYHVTLKRAVSNMYNNRHLRCSSVLCNYYLTVDQMALQDKYYICDLTDEELAEVQTMRHRYFNDQLNLDVYSDMLDEITNEISPYFERLIGDIIQQKLKETEPLIKDNFYSKTKAAVMESAKVLGKQLADNFKVEAPTTKSDTKLDTAKEDIKQTKTRNTSEKKVVRNIKIKSPKIAHKKTSYKNDWNVERYFQFIADADRGVKINDMAEKYSISTNTVYQYKCFAKRLLRIIGFDNHTSDEKDNIEYYRSIIVKHSELDDADFIKHLGVATSAAAQKQLSMARRIVSLYDEYNSSNSAAASTATNAPGTKTNNKVLDDILSEKPFT